MNGLLQALERKRSAALDRCEHATDLHESVVDAAQAAAFREAIGLVGDYDPTDELRRAMTLAGQHRIGHHAGLLEGIHGLLELADAKLSGTGRTRTVQRLRDMAIPRLHQLGIGHAVDQAAGELAHLGVEVTALERRLAVADLEQTTPRTGATGRSRLVAADDALPEPWRATLDATDQHSRKVGR